MISPCGKESMWFLFVRVHHCMGGSGMIEPLYICLVDRHKLAPKLSPCHSVDLECDLLRLGAVV